MTTIMREARMTRERTTVHTTTVEMMAFMAVLRVPLVPDGGIEGPALVETPPSVDVCMACSVGRMEVGGMNFILGTEALNDCVGRIKKNAC